MGKRRPSGDGMIRRRESGRWEGRIVVGHKENGDSIFHYVSGNTQIRPEIGGPGPPDCQEPHGGCRPPADGGPGPAGPDQGRDGAVPPNGPGGPGLVSFLLHGADHGPAERRAVRPPVGGLRRRGRNSGGAADPPHSAGRGADHRRDENLRGDQKDHPARQRSCCASGRKTPARPGFSQTRWEMAARSGPAAPVITSSGC